MIVPPLFPALQIHARDDLGGSLARLVGDVLYVDPARSRSSSCRLSRRLRGSCAQARFRLVFDRSVAFGWCGDIGS